MHRPHLAALALAATAAFTALPAAAQGYIGGDVAASRVSEEGLTFSATGAAIFGGYQFGNNVAVEAGYRNLGTDTISGVRVKANAVQLSVLGILPLSKEASIYGRLGVNTLKAEGRLGNVTASERDTRTLVGFGARYAVTPSIALRAEFQKPASDTNTFAGGVEFRF